MEGEAEGQHRQRDDEGQRPDAVAHRAGQPAQQALAPQHGGERLQQRERVRPALQRQAGRQRQRRTAQQRPGPAPAGQQDAAQPDQQHHQVQPEQADESRYGVDAAAFAQHGARQA
ncbi:MAG: hypothetical protein R3E70_04395 [Burkholderiaceae bacterium]